MSGIGPAFDRLWGSNLSANLGDGLAWTAAPLLAVQLTDDPAAVAAISTASYLPWLIFGVLAGVTADRMDRRWLLAGANAGRFLILAASWILVVQGSMTPWGLVAMVFGIGVLECFVEAGAQAALPALVSTDQLDAANVRVQTGERVLQQFAAPSLGAAAFALSVSLAFGVSALSFGLASVLALLLPRLAVQKPVASDAPRVADESFRQQLLDGGRFIWHDPGLRLICFVTMLSAALAGFAQAALVVYLVKVLKLPDATVGVFLTLSAIGAIVGSAIAGRLRDRIGRGWSMAVGAMVTGPAFFLMGVAPSGPAGVVVAGLGFVLMAASIMIWNTNSATVRQRLIPIDLMGRVSATWRTAVWALIPVTTLVGGAVARMGLRLPFVIAGVLLLVLAIVTARPVARVGDVDTDDSHEPRGAAETSGGSPAEEPSRASAMAD
jgi:MFS family permease